MISYKANVLYKSNLTMLDMLANFDWKRPVNFSSGGMDFSWQESLKKGIFDEYGYYMSLSPKFQAVARRQIRSKPMEYALVISAVIEAYRTLGQNEKAHAYLLKPVEPIDEKFNVFVKGFQQMGKEKAMTEAENVQQITPFYQYLFEVMEPFDSAYSKKKEEQITTAIIKVTQ